MYIQCNFELVHPTGEYCNLSFRASGEKGLWDLHFANHLGSIYHVCIPFSIN